jgi:hypothetical protein
VRERSQSENDEPRVLRTTRWWTQLSQSPARMSALYQMESRAYPIMDGWPMIFCLHLAIVLSCRNP